MSAVPIYKGEDFYMPAFEMRLRGEQAPVSVVRDVIQVSYTDSVEKLDSFAITINNWDADKRRFKYSDAFLFDPGVELQLRMGYHPKDHLRLMVTGEIVELRPSFPAEGQPTLVVSGLNLLHRFRGGQESHAYKEKTPTAIARQIAKRLKVKLADTAETKKAKAKEPVFPYLVQHDQLDLVFLLDLARKIGYDLLVQEIGADDKVKERQLYFGPSQDLGRPTYELKWGVSLRDFRPTLSTANQVGSLTVRGWDAVNKKPFEHKATLRDLETKGLAPKGRNATLYKSFEHRTEVVATQVVESEAEAEKLAIELLQLIAKGLVTGKGTVVGLPDLRAGSIVQITGLGSERFDGRYFVTESTHTINDSGYLTEFTCRREELEAKR
jgi:phage protein D